jgi:hypothetical protein
MTDFNTWTRENLVHFCEDASKHMAAQDKLIAELKPALIDVVLKFATAVGEIVKYTPHQPRHHHHHD